MRNISCAVVLFLCFCGNARAEVIKRNSNANVTGNDLVMCVAVNVYLMHPQLSLITQTVDAPVKDLCQALAAHDSIEEVHLLSSGDANAGNLRDLLKSLAKRGTYGQVTFVYRGLGYGGDTGQPHLMLADWRAEEPESALDIRELDQLLDKLATHNFVILDASMPASDVVLGKLVTVGPSASDWPSTTSFVISPTGPRVQTLCGDQMLRVMATEVRAAVPDSELRLTVLQKAVLDDAERIRGINCPAYAPATYGGTRWADDALVTTQVLMKTRPQAVTNANVGPLPAVAATVQPVVPPAVRTPANGAHGMCAKGKKVDTGTLVLGGAGVALTVGSIASGVALSNVMHTMRNPAAIAEHYGNSQEELNAAAAMRPVYGHAALWSGVGATASLLGAGIAWCW